MRNLRIYGLPFLTLTFAGQNGLHAEVTINAPIAITHRVEVQPIRVSNSSGTAANAFGSSAQETYIKNQINRIWSQAGVRIDWLPILSYTDNFTYQGTASPRPQNDLFTIAANTPSPPKSANPIVLNLFFVQIVPGSAQTASNVTNGLAILDGNGVTVYNGSDLFTFSSNVARDRIAKVMAHEIGHNLGLNHDPASENLLFSGSSGDATTTYGRISTAQINTIFTNNNGVDGFDLLQPIPAPTNYSQWASTNNVTGGPNGDDDLDGVRNVIEFMFQKNPKTFDKLPVPVQAANGLTWTLPKYAPATSDGLVYRVTTSENLTAWLPAGSDSGRSTVVTNDASSLVVRLNSGAARRFMRLDIDIPTSILPATSPATAAAARGVQPEPQAVGPVDADSFEP